jgi:hypothetical protein
MRCIIFLFIGLLYTLELKAQPSEDLDLSNYGGRPLTETLEYISEEYGIAFSYDPEILSEISTPFFDEEVTVQDFLEKSLPEMDFELIAGTYVIVPLKLPLGTYSISGVVRDSLTGESLPFATVLVENSRLSATTNSDGKFTLFNVPGNLRIFQIKYLGYATRAIRIPSSRNPEYLVIELIPQKRNLPSIEITAEGHALLEMDQTIGQLNFNPIEIVNLPNLGEPDVFAALRRLPGIAGGTDADSGLRIRGGQTDQNMVMFDGIPVYHVDHFFGFLSAFNSNVIKNIRVNKGGFEAKYGGRSSGLVNITGIDGNKLKPSIQAEATLLSANILAELPVVQNKASLVVAYRRAFTNLIQTPTYRNIFNNIFNSSLPNTEADNVSVFEQEDPPNYFFYDLNAKFNFKPSKKDALSFSYYRGQDDLGITFERTLDGLTRRSEDQTDWGNTGGSIKWSRQWTNKFFMYANYGISRYESTLNAEEFIFFPDELISRRSFEQKVQLNDNTFRLDNTWEFSSKSKLEFGWWNTHNAITSQAQDQNSILRDSTLAATTNAFYTQLKQDLGKTSLNGGIRVNLYTETGKAYVEPRLAVNHQLNEDLSLKAAYGIYHQMIRRLNERSLYLSVPETWTLAGDETIPVLRSDHYLLGASYTINDWEFSAEGYHKYERGVVEYIFPEFGIPTGDLDQFSVDGKKRIYGLDLLAIRNVNRHSFMLGYTYLNSDSRYSDLNGGAFFPSPGVSEHEFSLVYSLEYKRWDISGGFTLASGIPFTPVLGTFVVTLPNGEQEQFVRLGRINSENLPWYHRLDISAGYTLPLKSGYLRAGFSIFNVYNQQSVKYIDYFQIPEENSPFYSLGRRDIPSLGFTPSLFLKIKL